MNITQLRTHRKYQNKAGSMREIVNIIPITDYKLPQVIYRDAQGKHRCCVRTFAKWAEREVSGIPWN